MTKIMTPTIKKKVLVNSPTSSGNEEKKQISPFTFTTESIDGSLAAINAKLSNVNKTNGANLVSAESAISLLESLPSNEILPYVTRLELLQARALKGTKHEGMRI